MSAHDSGDCVHPIIYCPRCAADDADGYGYCNACGEEAPLDTECCEDGEVVEYEEGDE